MMQLRHLTMVNWHLFDVADIEVTGHVGVLGENRSGKSTILDMAQVVLTGGNRRFLRLNAVAGDGGRSRGSSKRSVVDYCLGTLGEDQRRRDEARTYIALGFEDTDGARPSVTIGMALEARKSDSRETVLALFIAVGAVLTSNDFIEQRGKALFPAQWEDARARIISAVGEGNFVNHRDRASDYVREYMRHLLPHSPYGEQNANALQKSIVNAMTLDHNQTATQFVRNYILEDSPIGIKELRESIQTYRNISDTIRKMRLKLEALKELKAILTALEEALETKFREQWIGKRAEWLAARAINRDFRVRLRLASAQREAAGGELKFLNEDIRAIDDELQRLTEAIAEHDAKTGRKSLQQTAAVAEQSAQRAAADFKARIDTIRRLQPLCAMGGRGFDDFIPAVDRLLAAVGAASVGAVSDELVAAENALTILGGQRLAKIDEARQEVIAKASQLRTQRDDLMERVRQHASGGARAHLEPDTERLCLRLRQKGMAPRVLCELIEVAEPGWTGAAEALLGRDRDAVFVDRPHIGDATAIFKEGRREFRRTSLVSLNKLEQFRAKPEPGTFPSIFRTEDPDALSFIMRRYGSVRLADTLDQFNRPGRAIMKDGLYDDGLVRTHRSIELSQHKIGKAAQANALRALHEQADELEVSLRQAAKEAEIADGAFMALKALCDAPAGDLKTCAAAFAAVQAKMADAQAKLAALDDAGDGGLRQKKRAQQQLKDRRIAERETQQTAFNKHDGDVRAAKSRLGDGENVPGSELNLKIAWSLFVKNLPLYSASKGRPVYRARLDARAHKNEADRHRSMAEKAVKDADAANDERGRIERQVREFLDGYFDTFGVSSQIGIESEPLQEVKPWMAQLIEEIESNELRQYERQARDAAEKASMLLRGEFINALSARIGKMERELQSLNRSLYAHPFHNERYSFHRTQVVEFQPILKIIEIGKTSPEALDMLFRGDVSDDFPHKDTILALEALLEDPDKDFTQFEDYRNFYTFEIHMEDVGTGRSTRWEQRRGTGSGAEQQVPIYVAIGASLAAVYGSAERRAGKPAGFALAMFDEVFSKMDGKNQRQMMSFYKNLGLQFVIAAPFEKRVAVLEHMDTIVEVDRIGEQSRATVVSLKEKAKRELRAIDPDLMTADDLAARLAAE
ncbi:SbcC/MukB-like Walker B domain-containing protein [Bradyrhizobium australafricanum]|uniref:SbcC/MukB-like Walker B domain-containing protein n=1 Tax=Bradyrhizobium australafricanum TaxID=2821406 RepID=UPI001CE26689|nr:SbcC/MukB-like Walker B domain-containing protein [Bradyrhizobium australafricanum]MCA6101238.1 AAA family ATPase [Bradyrhizobium australafricanum]